ncbi:hypothetical protein GCM10010116_25790 [Microbispora rosea subsp. aerata]|nr:hypothetical protein GCM10010116_25790 [Microbispora rosea subsp. aerata]GIH54141.1 hypothetical protein Mro02_10550 [Microbispora rosea subsp. aerata]GLJ85115.1 hypothetical protein GCM10017588_38430 [Microbispora rosea subsp. aerata]
MVILRSPLRGTGQPSRHEYLTSSRDTFSIFAENGGGPLGLGVTPVSGAGDTGMAEGATDADEDGEAEGAASVGEPDAGDVAAGGDTRVRAVADAPASPTPAQPVIPTRAAIITADLRFHKEVIGAGYPRRRHGPGGLARSCGQRDSCG